MHSNDEIPAGSPFHSGEIELQRKLGVAERMDQFGRRVIRDHMPEQHRDFFEQLPFLVAGTVDATGDVWATLLAGEPGFAHSPDPRQLTITLPIDTNDPAISGEEAGGAIGILGIELNTRRRNRMNGAIASIGEGGFSIAVEHSFGNCPQYIQTRNWHMVRRSDRVVPAEQLTALDDAARVMITGADTFFVASYIDLPDGRRQVDASHRGGKPGFVRIDAQGKLTIPDFAGNLHFNTLGNFLRNPRAGLVFVDFDNGDMLQLTGDAEVILDSPDIAAFQGAERLWTFVPRKLVRRKAVFPLRFDFLDWSPNSLMTGDWEQAEQRRKAAERGSTWRPLRVAKIVDESSVIRSFHLEPTDDAGLIANLAGQHLPIRVKPNPEAGELLRTYTLSSAPSDGTYRISVKREGLVSKHLHDTISVGSLIEARPPAGSFTIDAVERRPAVLMAAGVGITPILSMLRHVVYEGLRTRRVRPTTVFYAARSKAERAFDSELRNLAELAGGAVRIFRLLEDTADAERGSDYEVSGRIDMDLLRGTLGFDDYDFLMCGPPPFMQAIYDGLRGLNVADSRIHAEAFGPASLKRKIDEGTGVKLPAAATGPVPVAFAASGKEARWTPEAGTLLELAEARGLSPEFSCRGGSCGTCKTKIAAGAVTYPTQPVFETAEDEALICCAVPAAPEGRQPDRLILDL
ncbi:pyridoxamine 5'-phosphate oxidase family protein [Erythrobacter sp.]|uniref:2Fe-2S iron-sulfur cluster-binding protein n=1 Tax=Erythrobacter sp. TaxID=1042 RepID=UPI00311D593A